MSDIQTDDTEVSSNPNENNPSDNLKFEFQRKFENLSKANETLANQNAQLNAKLDAIIGALDKPKESNTDLEDLKYTDPDKYIEMKMQEVEGRVESKIQKTQELQSKKNEVLSKLASDYPEINNQDSELYKHAINLAGKYDANFVNSPEGIQLLVREAAAELGVLPSSKRKVEETDMSEFIGGGSGNSNNNNGKKAKTADLDPKTIVAAKLMGLDTNDPKVIERLKERSKRKNWTKYS